MIFTNSGMKNRLVKSDLKSVHGNMLISYHTFLILAVFDNFHFNEKYTCHEPILINLGLLKMKFIVVFKS